jgi:DNA polymerase-3 subunit gamma/tau
MLLPDAPQVALAGVGADERGPLEEQANNNPTAEVVRLIETSGDTLGRIKRGGDPKLEIELSFLRLTRDYTEPSVDALLRRLEALELAVERGEVASRAKAAPPETTAQEPAADDRLQEEVPGGEEPEDAEPGVDGRQDLAAQWEAVMQDLRDRRQAPAAAVYEEARVEGFDGEVLELAFPEELAIYARLARDDRHADPLRESLGRRLGVNPRIECRVADGAGSTPAEERARPEERPMNVPEAHNGGGSEGSGEPGSAGAEDHARAPGEAEADDTIRDQREVFEMARERFGLFDQDKGS